MYISLQIFHIRRWKFIDRKEVNYSIDIGNFMRKVLI